MKHTLKLGFIICKKCSEMLFKVTKAEEPTKYIILREYFLKIGFRHISENVNYCTHSVYEFSVYALSFTSLDINKCSVRFEKKQNA